MKYLTPFLTSVLIMLSLLSNAYAGSAGLSVDQFPVQQSEATDDGEGAKRQEGEEEEPEC